MTLVNYVFIFYTPVSSNQIPFEFINNIQSNLYMTGTPGNLKIVHYEQLPFIYRSKVYALFIKGENESPHYRQ
jgi:hypothetical protein